MGRTAKTNKDMAEKPSVWEPICPKCGRARVVGELCGGTHPKFYCRNCLIEFSVKKSKGVPVSARVYTSTSSGVRVRYENYKFDQELQRFVFHSSWDV